MANKNKIINQAQKFIAKGQWDKAVKELQRLVAEDPKDVRTLLKLGDVFSKKGDRESATKVYRQVAESYSEQGFFLKAVAVYKQILKHDPKHLDVTLRLAELYEHLGLTSEAMIQYQAAAQIHDEKGAAKESLAVLRRMVDLDAENVASRIKLAESYSREGMLEQASEEFGRAADLLERQHRIEDYVKVAERLVYHASDRLDIVKKLAKLYLERGDTKRGLAKLQMCFKAEPQDIETLRLLAHAFNDLGQTQKTVFVYRELARIHQERGQLDEAQGVLQAILALDPGDAGARAALGHGEVLLASPRATADPIFAQPEPRFASHPGAASLLASPFGARREASNSAPFLRAASAPSSPSSPAMRAASQAARPVPASFGTLLPPPVLPPPVASHHELTPEPRPPSLAPRPLVRAHSAPGDTMGAALERGARSPEPTRPAPFQAPPAPPREATADQVAKVLTETDVYIKYGLREKALEHLRRVFEIDPDNLGAFRKMQEIYLGAGDTARAAEALANVMHVHARLGDMEALEEVRSELAALAPGHPLAHGGLPGAIPARLPGSDTDDNLSIEIEEDSGIFELVDFAESGEFEVPRSAPSSSASGHADIFTDDLNLEDQAESPWATVSVSEPPALAEDDLHEAQILDEELEDIYDEATVALMGGPPTTPTALPYTPEGARRGLAGAGGARDAQEEEGDLVSISSVVRVEAVEPDDLLDADPFASNVVEDPVAAPAAAEGPRRRPASAVALAPVELEADEVEDLEADEGAVDDELDEVEFLLEARLFDEAREALLDLLVRAPANARAQQLLLALPSPDEGGEEAGSLEPHGLETHGAPPPSDPDWEREGETFAPTSSPEAAPLESSGSSAPGAAPEDEAEAAEAANLDAFAGTLELLGAEEAQSASDHHDQGMAYMEIGRLEEAVAEFAEAAKYPPRTASALEMIGHCHLQNQDPASAIEYFGMALESGAEGAARINLEFEIGAAYELAGDLEGAIEWFTACAADDPRHRDVARRLRALGAPVPGLEPPPRPEEPTHKKSKISYL